MRRIARVDENQRLIVKHLEQVGATVQDASRVGGGFPDLVVGYRGQTYLIEIKNPDKPKADRQLTPQQVKWHTAWKGHRAVVDSPDAALRVIGVI